MLVNSLQSTIGYAMTQWVEKF